MAIGTVVELRPPGGAVASRTGRATPVLVGPDGPRVGELVPVWAVGTTRSLRVALGVDLNGAALSAALGEDVPLRASRRWRVSGGACVAFSSRRPVRCAR